MEFNSGFKGLSIEWRKHERRGVKDPRTLTSSLDVDEMSRLRRLPLHPQHPIGRRPVAPRFDPVSWEEKVSWFYLDSNHDYTAVYSLKNTCDEKKNSKFKIFPTLKPIGDNGNILPQFFNYWHITVKNVTDPIRAKAADSPCYFDQHLILPLVQSLEALWLPYLQPDLTYVNRSLLPNNISCKGKGHPCTWLRLCTGRTAHRGSRGIALLFHDQRH